MEPARWDDYALAALLLVIGLPRAVLALAYDRPMGAEGTLSLVCVALALVVIVMRRR